jgi:hypothetical protein
MAAHATPIIVRVPGQGRRAGTPTRHPSSSKAKSGTGAADGPGERHQRAQHGELHDRAGVEVNPIACSHDVQHRGAERGSQAEREAVGGERRLLEQEHRAQSNQHKRQPAVWQL